MPAKKLEYQFNFMISSILASIEVTNSDEDLEIVQRRKVFSSSSTIAFKISKKRKKKNNKEILVGSWVSIFFFKEKRNFLNI